MQIVLDMYTNLLKNNTNINKKEISFGIMKDLSIYLFNISMEMFGYGNLFMLK